MSCRERVLGRKVSSRELKSFLSSRNFKKDFAILSSVVRDRDLVVPP